MSNQNKPTNKHSDRVTHAANAASAGLNGWELSTNPNMWHRGEKADYKPDLPAIKKKL